MSRAYGQPDQRRADRRAAWKGRGQRLVRRLRALLGREDGFAAAEYAAGVAFLIFPVTVLVLSLPAWVETQSGARLAAQQAARAIVTAPSYETGMVEANAVVDTVLGNLDITRVGSLDVEGELVPRGTSGSQEVVTVAVTVRMPAISFPLVRDIAAFDHTVSHSQPVDLYRSTGG